jgi:uncharacterized membrane protein
MPMDEQERLKRLRDKQLAARDPLVKQRQFQNSSAVKEKRMRKPFSYKKALAEIPHLIKMPFYGLVLGVVVLLILPNLWISKWAVIVSGGLTLAFIIFGVVMGNSLDLRDEIRKHIN